MTCSRCTRPAEEVCTKCGNPVMCTECWDANLPCLGCVRKGVLEEAAHAAKSATELMYGPPEMERLRDGLAKETVAAILALKERKSP